MRCPICQKLFEPTDSSALPFCQETCREIDLGRWLGESYYLEKLPNAEADELPDDDWSQLGNSSHPIDEN